MDAESLLGVIYSSHCSHLLSIEGVLLVSVSRLSVVVDRSNVNEGWWGWVILCRVGM